jgi:Mg2+ and Co2+ transporter CorA
MTMTAGAWRDALEQLPASDTAVDAFLDIVELTLRRGVSCIAEYVFRSHRPDDLQRILVAGDAVVIVTTCPDPQPRLVERNAADRLVALPGVLRAAGASSVAEHTAAMVERMRSVELEMMTRFPVPTLTVDTTDQYDPGLDMIVEFAVR